MSSEKKTIQVVGAALFRNGELFLFRRRDQGKLEFPGGKIESGESLTEALVRELEEELGIPGQMFTVGDLLGEDQLVLQAKILNLKVFWVVWPKVLRLEDLKLSDHSEVVILSAGDLHRWDQIESDILPLDRKLAVEALRKVSSDTHEII